MRAVQVQGHRRGRSHQALHRSPTDDDIGDKRTPDQPFVNRAFG